MITKEQDALLAVFKQMQKPDRIFLLKLARGLKDRHGAHDPVSSDSADTEADQDDQPDNKGVIHLEGARAAKFQSLLADIFETVVSLKTATKSFPAMTIEHGEMHPTFTVAGFAETLNDKIGNAMDIASGDDLKEAAREARHAEE